MPGFDFTKETREKIFSFKKGSTDSGKYMNFLGLCTEFGGAEHQEAVEEAETYRDRCIAIGPPFCVKNPMTNKPMYLKLGKVPFATTTEEWREACNKLQ